MVDRPKKGGSKKKEKGTNGLPKQKTIVDMFAPKVVRTSPTIITLESSPEIADVFEEPEAQPPTAVAPADDHSDGTAIQNEAREPYEAPLPRQMTNIATVEALKSRTLDLFKSFPPPPPPNEPQTPSHNAISLLEATTATSTYQRPFPTALTLVQKMEGTTPLQPIIIESSPIRPLATKPLPKSGAVHPFFVRGNTTKQRAPQNTKNLYATWPVPFPDCVSQHVRGSQSVVPASPIDLLPRPTSSATHATEKLHADYGSLRPGLHQPCWIPEQKVASESPATESPSLRQFASTIPSEHLARHPSISRMVDRSLSGTLLQAQSGRTLAEKWRPRCAQEVLGNEASACYLRDWLRALEIQLEDSSHTFTGADQPERKDRKVVPQKSRKRPRVITEVVRPRYRKRVKADSDEEDDSWIVNDDEDNDEEAYSSSHYTSDVEGEPQLPSCSPIQPAVSLPETGSKVSQNPVNDAPQDLGELHNTILLVGPPGSGKTASVYACAEELGWEVFEVYPGIGKRNGSSIENLVGEVGKSHLVRQRPQGRHDSFVFNSPSKPKRKEGHKNWCKSDPDSELDRSSVPLTEPGIEDSVQDRPAQSLILLEEVDILFKDDHRFWETVKDVIRECKRPIICTCNDISLVPLGDLPLQRVLTFDACPSDTLASYLKAICCAEGRSVDEVALRSCIASREGQEEGRRSTEHVFDIRRAINSLDLSLVGGFPRRRSETLPSGPTLVSEPESRFGSGPCNESVSKEEILGQLKKTMSDADTASFLDSELTRNGLDRPAAIEIESLGRTTDDEIGHPILHATRLDASLPCTYTRDMEMGAMIRDQMGAETNEGQTLTERRQSFRMAFGTVLGEVCTPAVRALGQAHLFTDYAPFIKQVAEAEERVAAGFLQQALERKGRQTRNSALSSYYRTLNLTRDPSPSNFPISKSLSYSFLTPPSFEHSSSSLAMMKDPAPSPNPPPKQISFSLQRDAVSSKSPALPSLEWPRDQRRGSITDPSLYAAPTGSSTMKLNTAFRQQPEQPNSASSATSPGHHDLGYKPHLSDPRPASPYVFGDATPQPVEHGSQLRKLLHSPSTELDGRLSSSVSHESQDSPRNQPANFMNGDPERQDTLTLGRRNRDYFDFSMRRHSIAAGAPGSLTLPHPSATHGTKRKLSTDRSMFLPVGEEVDPQLVGPGVPSIMEVDSEAPAPKRRGSTIDTHRIAQLSLEDRRSSIDSRITPWSFANERRDSAPALFPPVNMPGFAQALNPNEPPPSKLPGNMASFAWDQSNQSILNDGEHHINRPFDPSNQMNMIPPMNFPPDRRMSVPDTLINPPIPPSRVRRSRSRPPSRQDTGSSSHSGPNSAQEDANGASTSNTKGTTPYSRSPELRVSHKLAERQRRKEMKELYDDLRDQLPQDRGMKASKHETLTKAIEYVVHLKGQCQSKTTEIEALRREVEMLRQGTMPSFPGQPPPQHHQVPYGQLPSISAQFQRLPSPASQQQQPLLPPITSSSSVNHIINQNDHRADNGSIQPSSPS